MTPDQVRSALLASASLKEAAKRLGISTDRLETAVRGGLEREWWACRCRGASGRAKRARFIQKGLRQI